MSFSFFLEILTAYSVLGAIIVILAVAVFTFANKQSRPSRAVAGFKQNLADYNAELALKNAETTPLDSPERQESERLALSTYGQHFA